MWDCWGLQAHRTLCLSLSVRYRLWETGNIRETGQTGGGKRLGWVFSRPPGGMARRRNRVFPSLPQSAVTLPLSHRSCHAVWPSLWQVLRWAQVLEEGMRMEWLMGSGAESSLFFPANISCLGSNPNSSFYQLRGLV